MLGRLLAAEDGLSPGAGPAWLAAHRAQWARKPALRAVYAEWIARMRAAVVPGAPVIEIGTGPGFLKELWPEVVATDVIATPWATMRADATALPCRAGAVANLVLLDVFHHLPAPGRFLAEAARALRPGGRLVLVEPWIGAAGWVFYRFVHHEACDHRVSPEAPWGPDGTKDAMEGNAALPWLFLRPGGELERSGLPLRVVLRERAVALPWLLSGGFQPISLLPMGLLGAARRVDRVLSRVPTLTATRCLIVVERVG